jgi:Gas vesicle synthesis protein GvpL/GvpF
VIYLYAIADSPAANLQDLSGLAGSPVSRIPLNSMSAIVSGHDHLILSPDQDSLLKHQDVLDHLMHQSTVVPARFGTVARDTDDLQQRIGPRLPRLRALLDWFDGRCELAVRATAAPGQEEAAPDGAALSQVHEVLSRLSVAWTVGANRPELTASYLVATNQVHQFTDAAAGLVARRRDLHLSVTGPWAPFSFVDHQFPTNGGGHA